MKNDKRDLDLITRTIEENACYANPGPTAVISVQFIDETYILIPREALPPVNFGSLEDAFGPSVARIENITENVYEGDTEKMRWLAYQYLSMASYVDGKKALVKETQLKKERFEAYRLIYPNCVGTADDLTFNNLSVSDRNAVNALITLKAQLAEAKKKS